MMWIPLELIQEVLTKRKAKAFQVYVLMNTRSNGYFIASEATYKLIMETCGIKSIKTVRTHLNDLLDLNYFGYHDGTYYVRSLKRYAKKYKYHVEFCDKYFLIWEAFLAGAYVGWLSRHQRIKGGAVRRQNKGTSYQELPHSFPVSIASIMKALHFKQNKAYKYRCIAKENDFIIIEQAKYELTNLTPAVISYAGNQFPGHFVRKGKVFKRLPDEVIPCLTYRKKRRGKKTKHKRRDYKGSRRYEA